MFLNLKLKDEIDPKELEKFEFVPKYDVDTGKVKEYQRRFVIDPKRGDEKYFKFILHTEAKYRWFRRFEYEAWMSGFNWSDVADEKCMKVLYDLIINGIVETVDEAVYTEENYW